MNDGRSTRRAARYGLGLIVILSLVATACGSSKSSSSPTTASSAATSATTAAAGASGGSPTTAAAAASSGSNTPAPQPLPTKTNVTIAIVSPAEYLAPVYLGVDFGEFTKENLHVTITKLDFTDALTEMAAGRVQMLSAGASAGMFNEINLNQGFAQVGHTFDLIPNTKTGLFVRNQYLTPQGNINCADVPKMTFNYSTGGLGSSIPYVIKPVLAKCGYTLTNVKHVALGGEDSYVALENGAVSFTYLNTPQSQEAYNGNFAKLLPDTGYSLASYMMSTKFLKQQPEVAAAILRGIMRTQRTYLQGDYHTNTQVVDAIASFTGVTPAQVQNQEVLLFTQDLQFTPSANAAILGIQDIWVQYGIVDYKTPLALSEINNTTLATQVAAGCGSSSNPCTGT